MDSVLNHSLGPGFDALEALLDKPEEREEYERDVRAVMMTRQLLMAIDAERERRGMTKSELAELVGANPQVIRRMFTSEKANPTLKTVLVILAALRIELTFSLPETAGQATGGQESSSQAGSEATPEPEKRHHQVPAKGQKEAAA